MLDIGEVKFQIYIYVCMYVFDAQQDTYFNEPLVRNDRDSDQVTARPILITPMINAIFILFSDDFDLRLR